MCTCIAKLANDEEIEKINISQEKQIFAKCDITRDVKNIISIVCVDMLRELYGDDEIFNREKVKKVVEQFWK